MRNGRQIQPAPCHTYEALGEIFEIAAAKFAAAIAGKIVELLGRTPQTAPAPTSTGPLSLPEAAKALGCSATHLRRMANAGELCVIRLGPRKLVKVPPAEIARILAGESVKTPAKNGRIHVDPGKLTHNPAL